MKRIAKKLLVLICLIALIPSFSACGKKKEDLTQWKVMVKNNYDEFVAEISANSNYIPFIVHTDQHGSVKFDSEIYTFINDIVDWTKISKIINLGDTVGSVYNTQELDDYLHATQCLPSNKRIEQIGNHDRSNMTSLAETEQYFVTGNAEKSSKPYNYVVKDEIFNVRYVAIDYKQSPYSYVSGYLDSDDADFIINELSKQDDSDIVLLSHAYIFRDNLKDRYGKSFTGADYFIGSDTEYTEVKESFCDMLQARKNKTAGVLIDCEGKTHTYDFTECESDLLMSIHGHHHTEGFETYKGLTEFLFQSMLMNNANNDEPNCFYFCYIDRVNLKFKCWKNVSGYLAFEINLA